MCGIIGQISRERSARILPRVLDASASLAHRGPDDAGCLVFSPAESECFLIDGQGIRTRIKSSGSGIPGAGRADGGTAAVVIGHRRLAIIDPSQAGHQPMITPDGRYAVVLNGEIYNYLELKKELQRAGHEFRSSSDTEVLLAAYAQWGPECLGRLIGMYAFVVVDLSDRRLFMARDPFGMKPLYMAGTDKGIVFGSEISALLQFPGVEPRAEPHRLFDYLSHGLTDHVDETLFAGIRSLPPAHSAEILLEAPRLPRSAPYWAPDLEARCELSFPDATRRLRDLFLSGVELHLRSDARVGTMLSGGIDSSSVVMAMREVGGADLDIQTFSYIGEAEATSEEPWIDQVNAAARAVSHKVRIRPDEWNGDSRTLARSQDEPFGSLAVYAQNRVFREAAEAGVRVVLDGQGGDELFAGYSSAWPWYTASLLRRGRILETSSFLKQLGRRRRPHEPGPWTILAAGLARAVPGALDLSRQMKRARLPEWIDPGWCAEHGIDTAAERHPGRGPALRHALWGAVRGGSLPTLLRFEDRNSMAHSTEARLPFLTPQLAQFALSLPEEYLVAPDGTGKRILREAMRGIVPDPILDRKEKVGFSVPLRSWLLRAPGMADLLEHSASLPAVRGERLRPAITALRAGRPIPPSEIFLAWRMIGLALWSRQFGVEFDRDPGRHAAGG